MTVTTYYVGNALIYLESCQPVELKAKEWRDLRNSFLREQGVGGIIKNEKKSKAFPPWWGSDTEFWFDDPTKELEFIDKWK